MRRKFRVGAGHNFNSPEWIPKLFKMCGLIPHCERLAAKRLTGRVKAPAYAALGPLVGVQGANPGAKPPEALGFSHYFRPKNPF